VIGLSFISALMQKSEFLLKRRNTLSGKRAAEPLPDSGIKKKKI